MAAAHRTLDVHRIAVAMVAVGQHQQVRRGGMDHVEGIEHFAEREKVEVRPAEAACCDTGAREKGRLEARRRRQLGGQPVPNRRHHDEAGLFQMGAQALGGVHRAIPPGFIRPGS
jgi:hypothetical protein